MQKTDPPEHWLERQFHLKALKTSFRDEIIAGITIFLAMCYIIIVNPNILALANMDQGSVFVATCISAAIGCLVMGIIANYPIALAPGMGLNAFFTFSVCLGMGVPWQTALAAVFISGCLFLLTSLFKFREALINAIPMSLKMSIAGGVGLFLSFIALKSAGIVVASEATLVKMGDITQPSVLYAGLGLIIILILHHFHVRGAMIISILSITLLSTLLGHNQFHGVIGAIPSIEPTLFKLDFSGLMNASMVGVIFVFFLVDLFDSTGTLIGVTQRAGLLKNGKLPRLKRALLADSVAIIAGANLGTSSTTPYIESASGAASGGKTGLTAVTVGILFLLALFLFPLASSVPAFATAPVLFFIGALMIQSILNIEWNDMTEAVPAFITLVFMPFTYSIADGIALGFISYAVLKLGTGQAKTVPYMVWIVAILWVIKFITFGG